MIYRLSLLLSRKLAFVTDKLEYEDYFRYGFEIILGAILKIILLVILAHFLGVLVPTLLVVLSFVPFRLVTGGTHLDTYMSCLVFSIVAFLMTGSIACFTIQLPVNFLYFLHVLILIGVAICARYVPLKSQHRKVNEKSKFTAIIILICWYVLLLILYYFGVNNLYLTSLLYGLCLQFISITPIAVKGMRLLNNTLIDWRIIKL